MKEKNRVLKEVRFWTPLRVASTAIVLALVAMFGASSCNSNDPETKSASKSASGSRPNVTTNTPLNSLPREVLDAENRSAIGTAPIKLANYSGKVLLVNLWATWCGPCRLETPELVKLHKEYQSRGVEMVGLSTEDPDASAEMVKEFVRQYEVDYQVGWGNRDLILTLMQGKGNIPQSFIIARDGRIVKRFIGFHPTNTPPQLKQALEQALVEKG